MAARPDLADLNRLAEGAPWYTATQSSQAKAASREAGERMLKAMVDAWVDKLPAWLEVIHRILPIQAMGEVTRGTLASNQFGLPMGAFITLAVWCVIGFGVTYAAMTRRG